MTGSVEPFAESASGRPPVRGFLHRPASGARDGMVLTHGAGGDCQAPLLVGLAAALSRSGVAVLRCDLPFRQERRGPPAAARAGRDREGLRHAAEVLARIVRERVFLGGVSYGGRQASMLLADVPEVASALLLLSYPLHPPGRPEQLRTAHFPRLRTPTLFVHGSADSFGSLEDVEAARHSIAARTALLAIDRAGHGLGTRRAGRPAPSALERAAETFCEFAGVPVGRD